MKLNRHLGSSAAEKPVKFQGETIIITPQSRDFETSRALAVRRPIAYWIEAQLVPKYEQPVTVRWMKCDMRHYWPGGVIY